MNFLCCNIFNNLALNTKELAYTDIKDFYKEESKGFQFGTGAGGSTNAGESSLAPKGSTTIGLTSKGSEREQDTKATIGNGSIVIAGNRYDNNNQLINQDNNNNQPLTPTPLPQGARDSNPLAGLNRDTNNTQQITKDMITGALDGSMTVDNRLFTSDGRSSIASDVKNFGKNTKLAIAGASENIDKGFELIKKNVPGFNEGQIGNEIFGIVSSPFSLLGETGSYLMIDKNKIAQEDLINGGSNYIVLGQTSGSKGAENITEKDSNAVARVNPTDGGIGDTIKSGGMKVLNFFGLSDMVAMNKIVANDLSQRSNIYSVNEFHSQGTIIGVGAMQILNSQGIQLNYSQSMNAMGPAVYQTSWDKAVNNVSGTALTSSTGNLNNFDTQLKTQSNYSWNPNDGVRQVTAPRNPIEPAVGVWNLIFNIKEHGIDSYRK